MSMFYPDRSIKIVGDVKTGADIDLFVPKTKIAQAISSAGDYEFIGFMYHKDAADPVTFQLFALKNDLVFYKIREVLNYVGYDFYFQVNVPIPRGWQIRFRTIGAGAGSFRHHVDLMYF